MNTEKAVITEFDGLPNLKPLLSSPGPCVSIYLTLAPTPASQSAKANQLGWREIIESLRPKLLAAGPEGKQLVESLNDWEGIWQDQKPQGKTIVVFRSPAEFKITWLQQEVQNQAVVGPHFFIRPLLPELEKPKSFYILALSQKNVRLVHCTMRTSEEVAIPAETVTSFDTYMNPAKPDHTHANMTSTGPSGGHSKGVTGTTDTEREQKKEYLAHFFRQIDRGINELLRGKSEPVVLAGVEYELAQYHGLNTYPHLLTEDVQGAPNSLKAGEMHTRALEAIARSTDKRIDEILAEYNHKVGSGASNRLKDVVTAAHDGRVLHLLVSESLETTGAFDEGTHSVKGHSANSSDEEDLVNDAAVQTILHAGQVYSVSNKKMPNGTPLAAVFRY